MIRGINVGGNRLIKMDGLRELYTGLGFAHPRTYLQSGNVVCEARDSQVRGHGAAVEKAILAQFGFEVSVAVRTAGEMTEVLSSNPLAGLKAADPRFLHATFLVSPDGKATLKGVALPLGKGEQVVLADGVVYLYCPNGYGITKINNTFFERKMGVRATTRNWQTVTALERMAREGAAK
jgi:uncharacterized protein (DUF1697 family)